jgi:hypothetical protein
MQAASISSQFSGLRVLDGLSLLQSTSIPQASSTWLTSAIAPKRAKRAMKSFTAPFSILQWMLVDLRFMPLGILLVGCVFYLFFGVLGDSGPNFSSLFWPFLGFICDAFGLLLALSGPLMIGVPLVRSW